MNKFETCIRLRKKEFFRRHPKAVVSNVKSSHPHHLPFPLQAQHLVEPRAFQLKTVGFKFVRIIALMSIFFNLWSVPVELVGNTIQ